MDIEWKRFVEAFERLVYIYIYRDKRNRKVNVEWYPPGREGADLLFVAFA